MVLSLAALPIDLALLHDATTLLGSSWPTLQRSSVWAPSTDFARINAKCQVPTRSLRHAASLTLNLL